jgi:hypothetical protein
MEGEAVHGRRPFVGRRVFVERRPFVERGRTSRGGVCQAVRRGKRPFVEGGWRPFIGRKPFVKEVGGRSSREGGDYSSREGPFVDVVGGKNGRSSGEGESSRRAVHQGRGRLFVERGAICRCCGR